MNSENENISKTDVTVNTCSIPSYSLDSFIKEKEKSKKWKLKEFKPYESRNAPNLKHWIREDEENFEYPYRELNKKIIVFQYTEKEYEQYLKDDDWTKEETDYLFELCKKFDLRFPIIQDRFTISERSLEEIKNRYFSVSLKLLNIRCDGNKSAYNRHPIVTHPYNYEKDVERKKQVEQFYNRPKEINEKVNEIKEKLDKIKSIKQQRAEEEAQQRLRHLQRAYRSASLSENVHSVVDPRFGVPLREKLEPGTQARSYLMLRPITSNNNLSRRVDFMLDELGVGIRPMPTHSVHVAFEELRQKILQLLNLQKRVAKKEYQLGRAMDMYQRNKEKDKQRNNLKRKRSESHKEADPVNKKQRT